MLDVSNVTQIDVLEEYQLLLVLANKNLASYPLQALDLSETQSPLLKRPKKIQGHANFFKAGVCLGRHLVCTAKSSGLSTTVKVFEPLDTVLSNNGRPALTRLFQSSQESLKPFKVSQHKASCMSDNNFATGILYPCRVDIDTLLEIQVMCCLCSWLRSRELGDT